MTWNLSGEMREACSCNMHCPCWTGIKELMVMDQGYCGSTLLFRINDGIADRVDLSGRTLAMAAIWPGPTLFDGNGTGRLYIDEAASPDQVSAIEAIFQGKRGGPMEILASLTPTWLPTQTTSFEVQEENGTVRATVGPFGKIRSNLLKNEAGQPMTIQNLGFTVALQLDNNRGELAPADGTWSDQELPHEFALKSGTMGRFTWNGN
jgi:hypothetical protein